LVAKNSEAKGARGKKEARGKSRKERGGGGLLDHQREPPAEEKTLQTRGTLRKVCILRRKTISRGKGEELPSKSSGRLGVVEF